MKFRKLKKALPRFYVLPVHSLLSSEMSA